MRVFTAAEAKNRFGELLDAAQRGPVSIEKHGRPAAVLVSQEEYDFVQEMKLKALNEKLAMAEADVAAGRVVDAETAFREIQEIIARGDG